MRPLKKIEREKRRQAIDRDVASLLVKYRRMQFQLIAFTQSLHKF